MASQELIQAITQTIEAYPDIKLAYLFGSQARGDTGPLSDYDIAIYTDETLDKYQRFDLRLELAGSLTRALKTDSIDIVALNDLDQPALAYQIITNGKVLVDQEPYRLLVEPRILNEYFDFNSLLQHHKLTRA